MILKYKTNLFIEKYLKKMDHNILVSPVFYKLSLNKKIENKEIEEFLNYLVSEEKIVIFLKFLVENMNYETLIINKKFFTEVFGNSEELVEFFNNQYIFMIDPDYLDQLNFFHEIFPNPKKIGELIKYNCQNKKIRKIYKIWWNSEKNISIILECLENEIFKTEDKNEKFLFENLIDFFRKKIEKKIVSKRERYEFPEENKKLKIRILEECLKELKI